MFYQNYQHANGRAHINKNNGDGKYEISQRLNEQAHCYHPLSNEPRKCTLPDDYVMTWYILCSDWGHQFTYNINSNF